jgi:hypothetical protein
MRGAEEKGIRVKASHFFTIPHHGSISLYIMNFKNAKKDKIHKKSDLSLYKISWHRQSISVYLKYTK